MTDTEIYLFDHIERKSHMQMQYKYCLLVYLPVSRINYSENSVLKMKKYINIAHQTYTYLGDVSGAQSVLTGRDLDSPASVPEADAGTVHQP